MSIQALSPDVVAQIKSSIAITSLNGVICELVKNSLDAHSTRVDVSVDYSKGSCSVEDDGLGILPSEFQVHGNLGKLYHSSKLNSQTPVHGGRGTFLSSLSALALVTITSHHHLHRSHNSLTLHKSQVASRQIPATVQQHLMSHHGTRVTVRDLFGNMPVRVKQRALVAERERGNVKNWEILKRDVVALLLPWPGIVALCLRDPQTNQKMIIRPSLTPLHSSRVSRPSVCNILAQASFISHEQKMSWISVHASTPKVNISGTISLVPIATKHVQFVSFGIHPIFTSSGQSFLHDEINRLFSNSAFGTDEHIEEIDGSEQDGRGKDGRYKGVAYTNKDLRGVKKGIDRWPMFFINIKLLDQDSSISGVEDVLGGKTNTLDDILELLRVLMLEFLLKSNFRPNASRSRLPKTASEALALVRKPKAPVSSGFSRDYELRTDTKRLSGWTATSDNFAKNIRLPSFRQGVSFADSPFHSWSRVKQGAVSRPITSKALFQDPVDSEISKPATAPPPSPDSSSSTPTQASVTPKRKPLLTKDGKLLRAPFGDVIFESKSASTSNTPHYVPTISSDSEQASEDDEELVPWINPMTKVQTLINKRTGLTLKSMHSSTCGSQNSRLTTSMSSQMPLQAAPSPWISNLLKSWDNPVFAPVESSIPQISFQGANSRTQDILHGQHHHCSHIDIDRAFKEVSSGISGRISKDSLKHAEIICQVDQKFILVKVHTTRSVSSDLKTKNLAVLIDQHAADERIRVEALMEELCTPLPLDSAASTQSGILTTSLVKPLCFDLSNKEMQLLQAHQRHFSNWGILYSVSASTATSKSFRLTVNSLPPSILERCQSSPRLLIDLIRTEIWIIHDKHLLPTQAISPGDWIQRIHSCPQGILDMINSRACRSAIMFNDILSTEQCEGLIKKLAECKFPFQCAHGRPSLVPLVDLDDFSPGTGMDTRKKEGSFGEEFKRWKESFK